VGELQPMKFRLGTLDWRRTYLMGVVNLTPDSFSDGNQLRAQLGLSAAERSRLAGADLLDVGGESTRPGATPVPVEEEWRRIEPFVRELSREAIVSVDTYKAEVAARALAAGAELVNDVSGGRLDPEIFRVCANAGAAMIVGHVRGTPADMNTRAEYRDVVREVRDELAEQVARAREAGVRRILVDPGLGFAKRSEHNLALLAQLRELQVLGCPIVVGASRKSFLGRLTGREVDGREYATAAADTAAILHGANLVRVHDVAAQRDAVLVADAIARASA